MRDENEARFKRLRWRSRRGMLELDLAFKRFLDAHLAHLNPAELDAYEKLLELPDQTLLQYLQAKQTPPEQDLMKIMSKII